MDRKIETSKKKKWRKPAFMVVLSGVFLSLIFRVTNEGNQLNVERERVRIGEVTQSTFEDVIAIQGRVEPLKSFFLDAVEGGSVQEVFVEAGIMVKKGDALIRLSNTNLMLDFMNRETQIVEQINNLRNTRMQMDLNERNIQEKVLDIAFEKQNVARQYEIDTSLYASNVIARKTYQDSETRYVHLNKKQHLLESSYQKNKVNNTLQRRRIDQSIDMMERNLKAIRSNLENLTVKAPITGQLTALDAEIGESKTKGENLGRIDVLDGFLIRAQIDEHYLSRVSEGQTANFKNGNQTFALQVAKVFPEVSNNQFQVEFKFLDSIPTQIRRGQTLPLKLALSNSVNAVLVPRGAFYSSTGGKWVFVVSEDGSEAIRRDVKMGRQNPTFIEVLKGLAPGEKILTNSYDSYGDFNTLRLK